MILSAAPTLPHPPCDPVTEPEMQGEVRGAWSCPQGLAILWGQIGVQTL